MSWALTRERIADGALELLGIVAAGESPSAADRRLAMEKLNGTLHQLPMMGVDWPLLKTRRAEVPVLAGVDSVDLTDPAILPDYFSQASLQVRDSEGGVTPMFHATKAQYDDLTMAPGEGLPTRFFIHPDLKLWLWKTPDEDVTLLIGYQAAVDVDNLAGLGPEWHLGLQSAVAYEVAPAFGITGRQRDERMADWRKVLTLAASRATSEAPVILGVKE